MKRLFLVALMLAVSTWAQAANVTIADLSAQTAPTSSYIMEVENPGVASYKVTMANALTKAHGLGNWKWIYSDGSGVLNGVTVGASGTFPIFQGTTSAPIVSTLVLPNSGTAYKLPVFSAANTMTELAAAGGVGEILIGKAGAIPAWLAAGSAGKILMGAGAADPAWTAYTLPSTVPTTGKVLISDGTNLIGSTALGTAAYATIASYAVLDSPVFVDDITIASSGVKLTGSNGSLTILGLGDGQDEDIKIDLNSTANQITISSPASSATAVSLSALNLVTTGTISGKIPMITKSDNYTLGTDNAQEAYGYMIWMSGANKTLTLPAVSAGMSGCLYSTDAEIKRLDPNASDGIRMGAARDTDGDAIASTAAIGAFVCFVADGTDGWTILGKNGTWTAE